MKEQSNPLDGAPTETGPSSTLPECHLVTPRPGREHVDRRQTKFKLRAEIDKLFRNTVRARQLTLQEGAEEAFVLYALGVVPPVGGTVIQDGKTSGDGLGASPEQSKVPAAVQGTPSVTPKVPAAVQGTPPVAPKVSDYVLAPGYEPSSKPPFGSNSPSPPAQTRSLGEDKNHDRELHIVKRGTSTRRPMPLRPSAGSVPQAQRKDELSRRVYLRRMGNKRKPLRFGKVIRIRRHDGTSVIGRIKL
ncbi:MAG: hypothetical protein ACREEC_14735 [Thermoplasmata archaeon]